MSALVELVLEISADAGADEIDEMGRELRLDLLELDVNKVELVKGEPVSGAKTAEIITGGALLIELLPVMLPKVIEFLQSWVGRSDDRKLRIKSQAGDRMIELEYSPKSMTNDELKSLIETLTAVTAEKPAVEEKSASDTPAQDTQPATGS